MDRFERTLEGVHAERRAIIDLLDALKGHRPAEQPPRARPEEMIFLIAP